IVAEGTGRPVLKTLVDRQNDEFAAASEPTGVQQPEEVRLHAGRLGTVIAQDVAHCIGHGISSREFLSATLGGGNFREKDAPSSAWTADCTQESQSPVTSPYCP